MINRIVLNILLTVILLISFIGGVLASAVTDDALTRANSYLAQGQYFLALQETEVALKHAESKSQQSLAYGMMGNILLHLQRYPEARDSLSSAFGHAEDAQRKAGYANSLGVLYHKMGNKNKAEHYFTTALELAGEDSILVLQIKLNRLRALPQFVESPVVSELLSQISVIDSLEERIRYYLNLTSIAKSHSIKAYHLMQPALEKANADSNQDIDKALRIELLDSLAELLYERGNKDLHEKDNKVLQQQALALSEQASAMTGQMSVDDLLINIEWRKGKIYQWQGRDHDALTAFGKAVEYIQTIRRDIPIKYESGKSSFLETLGPIYLDYVRQLLKKSETQVGDDKQRSLKLVRQTIQQIKQTELEDYLDGRCMFEGVEYFELEKIDEQAAILYPIILQDRMELLIGIGQTIKQYTIPVSKDRIEVAARAISKNLRTPPNKREQDYKPVSEELYQWLIAPIEQDLESRVIKTLVIVPDGFLRLVPFAALFDGKQFLVEKEFALSISPGMSLLSNNKDARKPQEYRMLFAGLVTPGPALVEKQFRLQYGERRTESLKKNYPKSFKDEIKDRKEKFRLPQVAAELENLRNNRKLKIKSLLNENFTAKNFGQQTEEKNYEIVHIASHGYFSSKTDRDSFLMTYDDELKLDALRKFLKRDKDTQEGIELLTFSACQTAEGDDRAPLGFAGAALKSEALSALGSLWPISDMATARLMSSFYQYLTQHLGKAESLRKAQLESLKDPVIRDPYFWSAFILVGSWL